VVLVSNISFDELASIYDEESAQRELTELPNNFYDETKKFLNSLEEAMTNSQDRKEKMRLSKLYSRSDKFLSKIIKERRRKILLAVHHSILKDDDYTENMTDEEKKVFEELEENMEELSFEELVASRR